jgi:hypothetical protein
VPRHSAPDFATTTGACARLAIAYACGVEPAQA